ncbi:MAG TPA: metal-dependent hydrolase [Acidimicrobiales bacterium]|nr:metal-dependent hydrolase [Acidimicrobiales bacterium]
MTTTATAPSRIKARRTRFDLGGTPNEWVPGDLQTTHTIDSLHVALPPGERWFCDVFRDALPLITDDRLRDDVRGFIGQEATHAKAHDLGLEHLAGHGIDLRREVAWVDRARLRLRARAQRLPLWLRKRILRNELAAIATIEHYTAVLGVWIVQADLPGADPAMLDLLRWHGAEEVEHRSVAFDLYQHLDGGYARRAVFGVVASVGLLLGLLAISTRIMALDPAADRNLRFRSYRRAVRAGRFPALGQVVGSLREYLRRDYHPSHYGSTEVALAYLATSPGVAARARTADVS